MPASPTSTTSRLLAAYPQVLTTGFDSSRSFYCDQLGFSIVYEYGQPAFYALLSRGEARLNLRFVHQHPMDRDLAAAEDVLAAYIPVRGVKELYQELRDRDLHIAQPLTEQPWGARDFVVSDPDHNRLCFAEDI